MKRKELEFEIKDGVLSVANYAWFIDGIEAVFVGNTEGREGEFAIYVQHSGTNFALDFKSTNEKSVLAQYEKLCNALKKVNPLFDNTANSKVLINYINLTSVKIKGTYLKSEINLSFNKNLMKIQGNIKTYNIIQEKLKNTKNLSVTI